MNILLDTHAVIWFITDNPNLPVALKKVIEDDSNKCYVSLATHWEMSIKFSLDRLELSGTLDNIFEIIEASGFELYYSPAQDPEASTPNLDFSRFSQ